VFAEGEDGKTERKTAATETKTQPRDLARSIVSTALVFVVLSLIHIFIFLYARQPATFVSAAHAFVTTAF
jgi:hypothetical protein